MAFYELVSSSLKAADTLVGAPAPQRADAATECGGLIPVGVPIGTTRIQPWAAQISLAGIGIRAAIVAISPIVVAVTVRGASNADPETWSLNVHTLRCGRGHSGSTSDCTGDCECDK